MSFYKFTRNQVVTTFFEKHGIPADTMGRVVACRSSEVVGERYARPQYLFEPKGKSDRFHYEESELCSVHLFVGKQRKPHLLKDRGCRTEEQFQTVCDLLPEVDFAVGNPLLGDRDYNVPFAFLFYNHDGVLNLVSIDTDGEILHRHTTHEPA